MHTHTHIHTHTPIIVMPSSSIVSLKPSCPVTVWEIGISYLAITGLGCRAEGGALTLARPKPCPSGFFLCPLIRPLHALTHSHTHSHALHAKQRPTTDRSLSCMQAISCHGMLVSLTVRFSANEKAELCCDGSCVLLPLF